MNAQLKPAPTVGVFLDEPAEVYYQRRLDEANNTGLTLIDEFSPAHFYAWVHDKDQDDATRATDFGRMYHCASLEPEVFANTYSVLPPDAPRDLRRFRGAKKPSGETLRSIAWWDEFEAANAGKVFVPAADYDLALAMATSLRAMRLTFGNVTLLTSELIDACQTEVTVRWIDEETGIPCKLRADLWSEELAFAADIKSALNASREAFARAIARYRYHQQHAHYCEGFRAVGHPLKSFAFLPTEKARPFAPAAWHIDAASEERGWDLRQRAIKKQVHCLQTGEWPGYTSTVESIAIPAFAHYDSEVSR